MLNDSFSEPGGLLPTKLPKMIHGIQMITIIRVVPMLVYSFCAVYLCNSFAHYTSFPRVSRRNRALMRRILLVISLFNTLIVWSVFVMLVKDYLAFHRDEHPVDANLSGLEVEREDVIELICLYGFALFAAILVYFCEFQSHMQAFFQNFNTQHIINTELGWSIYYLLLPPNVALQRLLIKLDRYYGQRRIKMRRFPALQPRQALRTFCSSEMSQQGRATHKLLLPLPSNSVEDIPVVEHPVAVPNVQPGPLLLMLDQPLRRCISLESMPSTNDEMQWMN